MLQGSHEIKSQTRPALGTYWVCRQFLAKIADPLIAPHPLRSRSQAKIALKAASEAQILELEAIAKSLNLCARSIVDA